MITILEYRESSGRSPFEHWFNGLDRTAAAKVVIALTRIGTGNLYGLGFHLAFVVNSTRTFFAGPDARIGSGHFRDRITGAQLFAQLPVRPVRYASHGRNKDVIAELIGTELHAEENYRRKGRYFSRNDFPMAVCTAGSDLVERSRIKVRNIGPLQHRHLRAVPMQAIDGGVT